MKLKIHREFGVVHPREMLRKAVRWALCYFDLEAEDAKVVVVFKGDACRRNSDGIVLLGFCEGTASFWKVTVYAGRPLYQVLITTFHEIVHVKQVVRKQLTYKNGIASWEGSPVLCEYEKMPHEVEARRLALQMLVFYATHNIKEKLWKTMSGLGLAFKQLSRLRMP